MKTVPALAFLTALLCSTVALAATHSRQRTHASSSHTPALTADAINAATPHENGNGNDPPLILKAEVMLDRDGFSPAAIDGRDGDNFHKALAAFQQANNMDASGKLDPDTWNAMAADNAPPPMTSYMISQDDVSGPFDKRIPTKLQQMAQLPGLSYKDPQEELAEKFHMSQDLLRRLNPHAQFARAGEQIVVANVKPMALRHARNTVEAVSPRKQDLAGASVATIVVDKASRDVRAYNKEGNLIAFYPATIGSTEKPAPSGTFATTRRLQSDYHYNPKFAWKGVKLPHKTAEAE